MTNANDRTQREREGLAALKSDLRALHAILPGLAKLSRTEGESQRPN